VITKIKNFKTKLLPLTLLPFMVSHANADTTATLPAAAQQAIDQVISFQSLIQLAGWGIFVVTMGFYIGIKILRGTLFRST
jgi:hypothetical protein